MSYLLFLAAVAVGAALAQWTGGVLDNHGWVGFAEHPINTWRLAGVALLLAGVVLIVRH